MSAEMPVRRLGRNRISVSALGLGSWNTFGGLVTDSRTINDIISVAYTYGIHFFDMADSYVNGEAERAIGKVLQGFPRDNLVLSSKTYFPLNNNQNDSGLSRERILKAIDGSLQRIGTDYLDIYFCHRFDKKTPLEETVKAMNELIQQGKIRCWGTSQWTAAQIRKVHLIAEKNRLHPPVVEQPELNLLNRIRFEQDTQPEARKHSMGLVTYSPLASGLLTGKYDQGVPEGSRLEKINWLRRDVLNTENLRAAQQFKAISDKLGCTRAQLAIAWVMAQHGVSSVITGATCVEQLEDNLGALEIKISNELSRKLDKLFKQRFTQVAKFKLKRLLTDVG